jgi:hypothetical protein
MDFGPSWPEVRRRRLEGRLFVTHNSIFYQMEEMYMEFFASAVDTLKVLVMAIGCGLGAWGIVNLLEGYGADNPASKSQGMKQLMAGGGIVLLGMNLIPLLANLF